MNQQTLELPSMASIFGGETTQDFRFNFNVFSALRQTLRARSKSMPVTIMTRADFIHHITLHMPEVSARIQEDDFGILHLEMGAIKLATKDAIRRYEFHTVRRHFSFISYLFEHADNELYDAILISYLEPLFIGEFASEYLNARSLLPANLEDALKKAELRYDLLELQLVKY
jgi:hypothetical protein